MLGIPLAVKQGFWLTASHIKGKQNTLADTISRNNLKQFYSQAPKTMDMNPIPVPACLPQKHMYIHVYTNKNIPLLGTCMYKLKYQNI